MEEGSRKKFKYQSFTEKISKIDIDVFHRVNQVELEPTLGDSFFLQEVIEWKDLNCTGDFTSFVEEITPYIQSLPQILFHREKIIEIILNYLKNTKLATKPLLKLCSTLARDLRDTFYPYFKEVFLTLVELLDPSDPELIEDLFSSLSFLFKFLQKQLLGDLEQVFGYFSPLLEHRKIYIRHFASESFAFLLRKLNSNQLKDFLTKIMESLHEDRSKEYENGISWLLFEVLKGVKGQLHSKATTAISIYFSFLLIDASKDMDLQIKQLELRYRALSETFQLLCGHVKRDNSSPLWSTFEESINQLINESAKEENKLITSSKVLGLYNVCISYKRGVIINDRPKFWSFLSNILNQQVVYKETAVPLQISYLTTISSYFITTTPHEQFTQMPKLLRQITKFTSPLPVLQFFAKLLESCDREFYNPLLSSISSYLDTIVEKLPFTTIAFLYNTHQNIPESYLIPIQARVESYLNTYLKSIKKITDEECSYAWMVLTVLSYTKITQKVIIDTLREFSLRAKKAIKSSSTQVKYLYSESTVAMVNVVDQLGSNSSILVDNITQLIALIKETPSRLELIRAVNKHISYFDKINDGSIKKKVNEGLTDLLPFLKENLASPSEQLRRETQQLTISTLRLDKDESNDIKAIQLMLDIELTPKSPIDSKELSIKLRRIVEMFQSDSLSSIIADFVPHFLFGTLYIKFSLLWQPTTSAIVVFAGKDFKKFFSLFFPKVEQGLQILRSYTETPMAPTPTSFLEIEANSSYEDSVAQNIITEQFQYLQFESEDESHSTDKLTYHELLLKALSQAATLLEKNAIDQVSQFFLDFLSREYFDPKPTEVSERKLNKKVKKMTLMNLLDTFSKIESIKGLKNGTKLKDDVTRLLIQSDGAIQLLAMKCLLNWQQENFSQYREMLLNMADDNKYRDELTAFTWENIRREHRTAIVIALTNILFGKLTRRKTKSERGSVAARRSAIANCFADFEPSELKYLVDLLIEPFQSITNRFLKKKQSDIDIKAVPAKRQMGFLTSFDNIWPRVGKKLEIYLPQLSHVLIALLDSTLHVQQEAQATEIEEEDDEMETESTTTQVTEHISKGTRSDIRNLALRNLAMILDAYPLVSVKLGVVDMLLNTINSVIPKLSIEHVQQVSGLTDLILIFSKHSALATILKSTSIIPNVLKMLSSKFLASSVLLMVMDFVERLLDIEDAEENFVLLSSEDVNGLILNMKELLANNANQSDLFVKRQLSILARVSTRTKDTDQVTGIVSLLIPMIKGTKNNEDVRIAALIVINNLIPSMNSPSDHLVIFSQLFTTTKQRQSRLTVCETFTLLGNRDKSIDVVVPLISALNAFSKSRIDEYDYDARLSAYSEFNEKLYSQLEKNQLTPLIYIFIYYLSDQELSIRTNSSYALNQICKHIASLEDNDKKATMQPIVSNMIVPGIREAIKYAQSNPARVETVTLLGSIVRLFPALYPDLFTLTHIEAEADFFNNIIHIQSHRRNRALHRLEKAATEKQITPGSVTNVLLPILSHMLTEETDQNLQLEVCKAVGKVCGLLPWSRYYATLSNYLSLIPKHENLEKVLVRVACEIVDNFHFEIFSRPEDADISEDLKAESKIEQTITNKLLPQLAGYLKDPQSKQPIRIPVALTMVKVIKQLPNEYQKRHLPSLIITICQNLQSRDEKVRDATRKTLLSVAEALGPSYLLFITQELRSALTRGYQGHVLGFTLHFVLRGLITESHLKVGDIDHCLTTLLEIFLEDALGELAAKREVNAIAKSLKEAKTTKAYETFDLISRVLTFPKCFDTIIEALVNVMKTTDSLKVVNRIEEILKKIIGGLNLNPSVEPVNLLIFIHRIIQDYYLNFNANQKEAENKQESGKKKTDSFLIAQKVVKKSSMQFKSYAHLFSEFGLHLLHTKLKKSFFKATEVEHLQMIDPYVSLLEQCIQSKHVKTVTMSLKCLAQMTSFSLPSFNEKYATLGKITSKLLKDDALQTDISPACFKLFVVLLRDYKDFKLSQNDVRVLLKYVESDIEEMKHSTTFTFLKAILGKKIVVPEIYDLMGRLSKLLIRSESNSIRQHCSTLFLQFLLYYPMQQQRLEEHLDFLINNLNYSHETGRESVLEIMHSIFNKFPKDILNRYTEYFFMPLVVRLVNDESSNCRRLLGEVIKDLLKNIDTSKLDELMTLTCKWYSDNRKPALARAAAQVLGLFFDVTGKINTNHQSIVSSMINNLSDVKEDRWEFAYFTLHSIETLFERSTNAIISSEFNDIWEKCIHLLTYPHAWIRLVCSRIMGLYFATKDSKSLSQSTQDNENSNGKKKKRTPVQSENQELLCKPGMLFQLGKAFCLQLESEYLSNALAEQATKNLVFIGFSLYNHPDLDVRDEEEKEEFEENKKEEDDEEEDEIEKPQEKLSALHYLFRRLSFASRKAGGSVVLKSCVIKWMATMASQMTPESLNDLLIPILSPIYRITEADNLTGDEAEQLKNLCQEANELIKTKVGQTSYIEAYNHIRTSINRTRIERRKSKAFEAAMDPQTAILRKKQKRFRQQLSKKRKQESNPNRDTIKLHRTQ